MLFSEITQSVDARKSYLLKPHLLPMLLLLCVLPSGLKPDRTYLPKTPIFC